MKRGVLAMMTAGWLASAMAQGLTLNEARQQGRVGETLEGYLAPIQQDAETRALVMRINSARTEKYQQVAEANRLPVEEVAKMAGSRLVQRAAPQEYVRGINGQWVRRSALP